MDDMNTSALIKVMKKCADASLEQQEFANDHAYNQATALERIAFALEAIHQRMLTQ